MKKIFSIIVISVLLVSTGMACAAAETLQTSVTNGKASIAMPYTINGGTTGVFSRQQLPFEGFDGVQADVTLPVVSLGEKGDCPYVYFGFDWKNDVGNVEGGFQFIEDSNNPNYNKWTVFMRQGNDWRWSNNIVLEQGSTHHMKFYSVLISEKQVDMVIELDGKEVIRKSSTVTNFQSASVKAVTAIAMSKPFNGSNCISRSENSKITNLMVSTVAGGDQYADFAQFKLYKEWRSEIGANGMWFGTAECIPSYLHRASDGSISIYKETMKDNPFKVVGYYSGTLFNEPIENLQTGKMTHIIYAFLIPKEDGNLVALEKTDQLKELVAKAHKDGAKVYIALGGWSYQGKPLVTVFESVAASSEKRTLLIDNVRLLLKEYNLDGVELDWEHPSQNSIGNYEKLVVELKSALDQDGKDLTAALNGAWSTTAGPEVSKVMTDACLDSFSFINVMAYDMNNAEHSPLWFAEASINYWLNRGVPAEKIILGMPLYARPSWKQYRELVAENPAYAYKDYVATTPLESYYNGLNTLREKTIIAMSKAGGVMLFDVNEDTNDESSVVSMIYDFKWRMMDYSKEELKQYISVILNDRELVLLKEDGYGVPFIDANNRTLIPLRKPMEAIGAVVSYNANSRVVTVIKNDITVKVTIDENTIDINGKKVAMDTKAIIKDGRTYIPLRAIFDAFGYDVKWHGSSRTVLIS